MHHIDFQMWFDICDNSEIRMAFYIVKPVHETINDIGLSNDVG